LKALTLVRFSGKQPSKILQEIKKVKGIQDAFLVFGRFDGVVLISTSDMAGMKDILRTIQSKTGVKRTETLIEV